MRSVLLILAISCALPLLAGEAAAALAIEGTPGAEKFDFAALRKAHATTLLRKEKAPVTYTNFIPPADTEVIRYPSGNFHHFAWLRMPKGLAGKPVPAVVYFHPSFSLSKADLEHCQPFLDAGFAVLCPTFRGENGNGGHFEFLYGEADDARAAIEWLAKNPKIDAKRIYTFGHGIGGGISALMALYKDLPVRLTGSCGGVYPEEALVAFSQETRLIPFDIKNPREIELRLLSKNLKGMQRPHITIIGRKDTLMLQAGRNIQTEAEQLKAPLKFALVDGGHEESLPAALQKFCEIITKDLER
jgi:pimeloyl-ACP methyl ester carboxylesterase